MAKMAVVTMSSTVDKQANLAKFTRFIEEAAAQDVKVIVFPELSLNGLPRHSPWLLWMANPQQYYLVRLRLFPAEIP